MPGFELPENLRRAVEAGGSTDAEGLRHWAGDLPRLVEHPAERWSLVPGRPFQPGDVASWVAPAHTADGRHLALKVGWRHDEALHEAEGLAVWGGRGAVRPDPGALADRLAGLCDLDAERLRRWLFAPCVLEVDRSPHLRGVVRALAP